MYSCYYYYLTLHKHINGHYYVNCKTNFSGTVFPVILGIIVSALSSLNNVDLRGGFTTGLNCDSKLCIFMIKE